MQNRVKQVIETKAYTPSRFADHVGVPRATISHILSGRNKPSLEVVQKILNAFPDISAEWLVKGIGTLGRPAPSLFEEADFKDDVNEVPDQSAIKRETVVKPGEIKKNSEESVNKGDFHLAERFENESFEKKIKTQHTPLEIHKAKKSVKIVIIYSDGSYSEHLPSS